MRADSAMQRCLRRGGPPSTSSGPSPSIPAYRKFQNASLDTIENRAEALQADVVDLSESPCMRPVPGAARRLNQFKISSNAQAILALRTASGMWVVMPDSFSHSIAKKSTNKDLAGFKDDLFISFAHPFHIFSTVFYGVD